MTELAKLLYTLRSKPFETWREHGITIRALRANTSGIVSSATISYQAQRYYIYWLDRSGQYDIEPDH